VKLLYLPLLLLPWLAAQPKRPALAPEEQPVADQLRGLRKLDDTARAAATKKLALEIRALQATPNKASLALSLANLATEGDFGRDTLQEVTSTLALALKDKPSEQGYLSLAQLVRYEGMQAAADDPLFTAAMKSLEELDRVRAGADFTLPDLAGRSWRLRDLKGKVVLVNFWATWCPPCRKEMPDLEALYAEYKDKGLVVLAVSDEERAKVEPFIAARKYTFPVLLDEGRKVSEALRIEGIPKTFIYDREGRLAAQSIDMRTRGQFLSMLARAGLK
jgi:peroxiredoxin